MTSQQATVQTIADWVGGRVEGDASVRVEGLASLDTAGPGELTFADEKHLAQVSATPAAAVIVPEGAELGQQDRPLIRVGDVIAAVAEVLQHWAPPEDLPPAGVHPSAVIDPTADVADDAAIGPGVVIGAGARIGPRSCLCPGVIIKAEVRLGADCMLAEGVVVKRRCEIGHRVRIGPNSVIGFEGFGYFLAAGAHQRMAHMGNVVIEDDVDIGACVCVDRAKFGSTRIGRGTKVDNLVQIAHNVDIGPGSILAGQCGIAGSTKLGQGVVIGGSAGIRDNITLGDRSNIAACAAVAADVPPGEAVVGAPAQSASRMRRVFIAQMKLPDLLKRIKAIESRLKAQDESATDH